MNRIVQGQYKKCKFGCIYCFTNENYETNGQTILTDKILTNVDLIQPFCDYDVFACENCDWKNEIAEYIKYNKIVSFATKAYISEERAQYLAEMNRILESMGSFLHVGISITTIDYINEIEPRTTTFEQRVKSLINLFKYGIPCSVILRPLLPVLTEKELYRIIDETCDYCDNYVYGPLYLNAEIEEYLVKRGIKIQKIKHQAKWRKGEPYCEIFESEDSRKLERWLMDYCSKKNKAAFSSNDDAIDNIRKSMMENRF